MKINVFHSAMLLSAEDGAFLKEEALELSKKIICKNKTHTNCSICRRIDANIHPDLFILSEEEGKNIGIESIREVCRYMEIQPLESSSKVVVIERAHELTVAASNALLKSLEEPLAGRHFILLTPQARKLLPTLLSRTIKFYLNKPAEDHFSNNDFDWVFRADLFEIKNSFQNKHSVDTFLQWLKTYVRNKVVQNPTDAKVFSLLGLFDSLIATEKNIRLNANPTLQLEALFLSHEKTMKDLL